MLERPTPNRKLPFPTATRSIPYDMDEPSANFTERSLQTLAKRAAKPSELKNVLTRLFA